MYECFNCRGEVIWDADFTFSDYGLDDYDGIVHECHCTKCGARIVYYCPISGSWDDELEKGDGVDSGT